MTYLVNPFLSLNQEQTKMTNTATVMKHLNTCGHISIREAMDDYNMSGNVLTKVISDLRKAGTDIRRIFARHPITGKRYARYYLITTMHYVADYYRS